MVVMVVMVVEASVSSCHESSVLVGRLKVEGVIHFQIFNFLYSQKK